MEEDGTEREIKKRMTPDQAYTKSGSGKPAAVSLQPCIQGCVLADSRFFSAFPIYSYTAYKCPVMWAGQLQRRFPTEPACGRNRTCLRCLYREQNLADSV